MSKSTVRLGRQDVSISAHKHISYYMMCRSRDEAASPHFHPTVDTVRIFLLVSSISKSFSWLFEERYNDIKALQNREHLQLAFNTEDVFLYQYLNSLELPDRSKVNIHCNPKSRDLS